MSLQTLLPSDRYLSIPLRSPHSSPLPLYPDPRLLGNLLLNVQTHSFRRKSPRRNTRPREVEREDEITPLGLKPWILSQEEFDSLETKWIKKGPPFLAQEAGGGSPDPRRRTLVQTLPTPARGSSTNAQGKVYMRRRDGSRQKPEQCAWAEILQREFKLPCLIICPSYLQKQ